CRLGCCGVRTVTTPFNTRKSKCKRTLSRCFRCVRRFQKRARKSNAQPATKNSATKATISSISDNHLGVPSVVAVDPWQRRLVGLCGVPVQRDGVELVAALVVLADRASGGGDPPVDAVPFIGGVVESILLRAAGTFDGDLLGRSGANVGAG